MDVGYSRVWGLMKSLLGAGDQRTLLLLSASGYTWQSPQNLRIAETIIVTAIESKSNISK